MTGAVELGLFESQMIQNLTITVHPFILSEYPETIYELINLKQTTTVEDYYGEFEGFLNCLQPNEEDVLSIFIHNLKSDISKSVRLFYPKTLTNALKLAKQLEWLFDELPEKPSLPDQNSTHTKQTIIPASPKQPSPPSILIETVKPSMVLTANLSFYLNPFQANFVSNMLVSKEIKESKFDEISSEIIIGHARSFTARSFVLKNVQPSVARYKVGIIDACKKLEGVYSMVYVTKNMFFVVSDPYGFRLLVMGRSNDVMVTVSSSSDGLFSWLIEYQSKSISPQNFSQPTIIEMKVFELKGLQYDEEKALNSLLDAFGSIFSLKGIAFAYCELGQNVDLACKILYEMQESSVVMFTFETCALELIKATYEIEMSQSEVFWGARVGKAVLRNNAAALLALCWYWSSKGVGSLLNKMTQQDRLATLKQALETLGFVYEEMSHQDLA